MIGRNGEPVFLQREDIAFYRFANILNGLFFCFSLADTSRKTRTFCDPVASFTGIEDLPAASNYLSRKSTTGLTR
jgi:hypothetical protein